MIITLNIPILTITVHEGKKPFISDYSCSRKSNINTHDEMVRERKMLIFVTTAVIKRVT